MKVKHFSLHAQANNVLPDTKIELQLSVRVLFDLSNSLFKYPQVWCVIGRVSNE